MTVVSHGMMAWDKAFGMLMANLRRVVETKQAFFHVSLCKTFIFLRNFPERKKEEVDSNKKLYEEVP
jgi:hypothetical protein